jgi:hypothetical protein
LEVTTALLSTTINRSRAPRSPLAASRQIPAPAEFAERSAYLLLPTQPDHQAQRFFNSLLLGGLT